MAGRTFPKWSRQLSDEQVRACCVSIRTQASARSIESDAQRVVREILGPIGCAGVRKKDFEAVMQDLGHSDMASWEQLKATHLTAAAEGYVLREGAILKLADSAVSFRWDFDPVWDARAEAISEEACAGLSSRRKLTKKALLRDAIVLGRMKNHYKRMKEPLPDWVLSIGYSMRRLRDFARVARAVDHQDPRIDLDNELHPDSGVGLLPTGWDDYSIDEAIVAVREMAGSTPRSSSPSRTLSKLVGELRGLPPEVRLVELREARRQLDELLLELTSESAA